MAKSPCPVSRTQFLEKAEPVKVAINGQEIIADKREFSTGSFGWYYNGKINVTVDGKPLSHPGGPEPHRGGQQGSGTLNVRGTRMCDAEGGGEMRHQDLRYAEAVSDGGPSAPALEATILSTRLGGTGEAAAADALVGTRLRHFEVKRLLGKGGMGAVYLGTDTSLERPVALKVLAPEIAHDPEVVARFVREARAQARLRHPNVAQIYFIGEDRGLQFFALEFLEGPALDEVLAQRRVPWADALDYTHGRGPRPAGGARPRVHPPGRQAVEPDPRPGSRASRSSTSAW